MSEQLQDILQRIQQEGIEKADAKSDKIVSEAEEKAKKIVADAKKQSEKIVEDARKESESFTERGKTALQQAARDLILATGEALTAAFQGIVDHSTSETLTDDVLKKAVASMIDAYAKNEEESPDITVLLSKKQVKEVKDYLFSELKKSVTEGLEVKGDDSVISGFKVSMEKKYIEHDFTGPVIARALGELVSPALRDIVKEASRSLKKEDKSDTSG